MTNIEVIKSRVAQPIPSITLENALINQELNPSDQYDTRNNKSIDIALIDCLFYLCTNPQSVKELDYSITQHTIDDWLKLISFLCSKHNLPDPTIKNKVRNGNAW